MTSAEEKTYKFICRNHSSFCRVDVLEILPYLPCLTPSDQDRLRASYSRLGNRDTLWDLFNTLQRRTGWVESLIGALRTCELSGLADQVNRVYQSSQPSGTPPRVPGPVDTPEVPAEVPAARNSGATHSIPHNGYQEELSYPQPVQDTQTPKSPRESSEAVPQTPSLGAIQRRPSGSSELSSNLLALSPTPSGHQEQNPEPGSTHGAASSVPSATTLKPVDTVTSRVPASPVPANVLTNPAPSKHAGLRSSKVPTSIVSTKAPTSTVPSIGSSGRAKEMAEAPVPTATIGGSSPWPVSSSGNLHSAPEMSKPGELKSREYSQPYSGCSADLAISPSSSLASEPTHGPEENEYVCFGIHVAEDPSANLMAGNPEPHIVLQEQEEEEETSAGWSVPWTSWLGAAVASALLGVLLAVLYRRRPLQ
ncbi:mitochondrial antiviral-signaling protein isoform X2 [Fukomys damarensis]|uniref:mitochondrial antiviral-signaling protein isoform X2 n=1 Tax=Fukomys damarensis TaxID=885580 RepID=UPI00053F3ED6|nr:mitochondrial antiviral-signaling protein isoform X2 [Fukomys damarensis]